MEPVLGRGGIRLSEVAALIVLENVIDLGIHSSGVTCYRLASILVEAAGNR
jgi:hypothetical protein